MKRIIFVCTGNICRSPTAHAIARHKAKVKGIAKNFTFSSAGIEGYHIGEKPDSRSSNVGRKKGVSFEGIFAKKITAQDFEDFDLLLAMDSTHEKKLLQLSPDKHRHKVKLFLQFCDVKNSWNDQVLDPYYKGLHAFDEVFDIIDLAIEKLLQN